MVCGGTQERMLTRERAAAPGRAPTPAERRARAATTVIFFMTGAVYAAWATRIPAVQERLELSPGMLALAIVGLEVGAIVGLPLGGALVARAGSRRALRAGFAVYPTALLAVALAPGVAAARVDRVLRLPARRRGLQLERGARAQRARRRARARGRRVHAVRARP